MKKIGFFLKEKENKNKKWDEKSILYATKRIIKKEYGNKGVENLIPDFFKNRKIFIKSKSSIWGNDLWNNKRNILKEINKELGSKEVEEIKIVK